jgi:hypothetical protein
MMLITDENLKDAEIRKNLKRKREVFRSGNPRRRAPLEPGNGPEVEDRSCSGAKPGRRFLGHGRKTEPKATVDRGARNWGA